MLSCYLVSKVIITGFNFDSNKIELEFGLFFSELDLESDSGQFHLYVKLELNSEPIYHSNSLLLDPKPEICCRSKELLHTGINKDWCDLRHYLPHTRVEQPMSDHLSAQGRLDPRGGLRYF